MRDQSKTKQALIQEMTSLKQRISESEQLVLDLKKAEEPLIESETIYRLSPGDQRGGNYHRSPHPRRGRCGGGYVLTPSLSRCAGT